MPVSPVEQEDLDCKRTEAYDKKSPDRKDVNFVRELRTQLKEELQDAVRLYWVDIAVFQCSMKNDLFNKERVSICKDLSFDFYRIKQFFLFLV